jgi:nucleoside-diphosphate-sugar epimerase
MRALVTGSSGHLGEALVRTLTASGYEVVGLDISPSQFTTHIGSIADRPAVERCMAGVTVVFHTATLHKPHVVTHRRQDFVDTNISGTLNLLEESVAASVRAFVFTSTTSVFGNALRPPAGAPAVWVTEEIAPVPRNIYGVTKMAAEALCELFHRKQGLSAVVLRTSRFFAEEDDDPAVRRAYEDGNVKANEYLFRRIDLEDAVSAHLLGMERAASIGFGRYIISATTPFLPEDVFDLRSDARAVLAGRVPGYEVEYERRVWTMFPLIERVYDNGLARRELDWQPRYDFARVLESLRRNEVPISPIAKAVGSKGYHSREFPDGPYPVD